MSTNYVYVIYDKTDRGYNKSFAKLCMDEEAAKEAVSDLKNKYNSDYAKNLVFYERVECLSLEDVIKERSENNRSKRSGLKK